MNHRDIPGRVSGAAAVWSWINRGSRKNAALFKHWPVAKGKWPPNSSHRNDSSKKVPGCYDVGALSQLSRRLSESDWFQTVQTKSLAQDNNRRQRLLLLLSSISQLVSKVFRKGKERQTAVTTPQSSGRRRQTVRNVKENNQSLTFDKLASNIWQLPSKKMAQSSEEIAKTVAVVHRQFILSSTRLHPVIISHSQQLDSDTSFETVRVPVPSQVPLSS